MDSRTLFYEEHKENCNTNQSMNNSPSECLIAAFQIENKHSANSCNFSSVQFWFLLPLMGKWASAVEDKVISTVTQRKRLNMYLQKIFDKQINANSYKCCHAKYHTHNNGTSEPIAFNPRRTCDFPFTTKTDKQVNEGQCSNSVNPHTVRGRDITINQSGDESRTSDACSNLSTETPKH